ncbi:MAG: DUF6687 family protein [Planctomycetota bacterium]
MDPLASLHLGFAGLPGTPADHLSVDGMTESGPNLSHWPGNRTPPRWKRDLSTGICLAFARAEPAAQRAFLGGVTTVLNDHYDTDGFGSLLALLRPRVAFAREELLLAAAATGDFGRFVTARAFAIDRIIARLAEPASPIAAEFAGLDGAHKSHRRYRWLLEHADEVLDRSDSFAPLYELELQQVRGELDAVLGGDAAERALDPALGLAHVRSTRPLHRMTLNTVAGAFRVLHSMPQGKGALHRYHDRTESWFELVTFRAPPRRDLRPLARRLDALEPGRDGARWCADPPTEPIPELYFGVPSAQAYGAITRELRPSALSADAVWRQVTGFFAAPAPAPTVAPSRRTPVQPDAGGGTA